MRPIDSSYDRQMIESSQSAQAVLTGRVPGDVLSYEDVEHLDDAAWAEIRDQVVEAPGEGWRIVGAEDEATHSDA